MDLQQFGVLDPDPQKYVDPLKVDIQSLAEYQLKNVKKNFLRLNPKTENIKHVPYLYMVHRILA